MTKFQANNENAKDEYEYDSSDEEDIRNTVGNIPMHWYDEYDHIGYNLDGQKINKPKRGDELDNFLNKMDNPKFGITVFDPSTGQDVVLPKSVVDTIKRLRSGKLFRKFQGKPIYFVIFEFKLIIFNPIY